MKVWIGKSPRNKWAIFQLARLIAIGHLKFETLLLAYFSPWRRRRQQQPPNLALAGPVEAENVVSVQVRHVVSAIFCGARNAFLMLGT